MTLNLNWVYTELCKFKSWRLCAKYRYDRSWSATFVCYTTWLLHLDRTWSRSSFSISVLHLCASCSASSCSLWIYFKVVLKGDSTSQVVQDDQVKGPLRVSAVLCSTVILVINFTIWKHVRKWALHRNRFCVSTSSLVGNCHAFSTNGMVW